MNPNKWLGKELNFSVEPALNWAFFSPGDFITLIYTRTVLRLIFSVVDDIIVINLLYFFQK